jgi:hypothetical protein
MSMQTWKQEFYASPASKVGATAYLRDDVISAVEHSLRKWEGLTEENLAKHEVELSIDYCGVLTPGDPKSELGINGHSCALCCYVDTIEDDNGVYVDCNPCPYFKTFKKACCMHTEDQRYASLVGTDVNDYPFTVFEDTGNPLPMIQALEKVLSEYKKNA